MDARTAQILKSLRTPKTYQELEDEFKVGYYTIRNHIQTLIQLGFVEEMPWPRQGTKQKQFKSNAYNPENQFSPEGCAVFSFANKDWTATQFLSDERSRLNEQIYHDVITLVFTALSAPMSEVFTDPGVLGAPHSSVVETKLIAAKELFENLIRLTEQLIHSGVWDDPEAAKILFDCPVENTNTVPILEAKQRLFEIANRRAW